MKRKALRVVEAGVVFVLAVLMLPILSFAQQFPIRPVNVLLGYAPGGSVDVPFRPLAKAAEKHLGQPLIISNNGAGGGTVALGILTKEPADGYHLEVCHSGLLTIVPHVRPVLYKLDDFVPIMNYGSTQSALAVKADSPWKTLKDIVDYARKNPGKFTYFGGAVGSPTHLAMEYLAKAEGVQFTMIPFPGGAPAVAALLGGHINGLSGNAFAQARDGSARLVAVQTESRMKNFPHVPTFRESGYDFVNDDIFMVVAPKGTPPALIGRLEEAFRKATEDPAFLQTMARMEILPVYRGSDELKKFLGDAYTRNGKMIQEFKIPKEAEKKEEKDRR